MIIRPPKYLRQWINFELRFGEDMILDKTKGQIRREKREADRKRKNRLENKWDSIGRSRLEEFLKEKTKKSFIWNSDFAKYKKKYVYDENFYKEYNIWDRKKKENERLEREFDAHYDKMVEDFVNDPYNDKITEEKNTSSGRVFTYHFSNGEKTKFTLYVNYKGVPQSGEISFVNPRNEKIGVSFSGVTVMYKFTTLINKVYGSDPRPSWKRKTTTQNNKRRRYDLLKQTLKGYQDQYQKEKRNGQDTSHTLNEINVLKSRIKKMEDKYGYVT